MKPPYKSRGLTVILLTVSLAWAGSVARADDDGYELVQAPAPELHAGKKAVFSLTLVPRAGHHLLADGPVLVRVSGDALRPARTLLRREDAVDPRAEVPRFELAVTADKKGPARLVAHCTFYLCKDTRCRPVETDLTWTATVN